MRERERDDVMHVRAMTSFPQMITVSSSSMEVERAKSGLTGGVLSLAL